MGDTLGTITGHNPSVIEKANKLLTKSDNETRILVEEIIREQNNLKKEKASLSKQNEAINREKYELQSEVQSLRKLISQSEKNHHKLQSEIERLKNIHQTDQSQMQQLKTQIQSKYPTKNTTWFAQASSLFPDSSEKTSQEMMSQCLEEQDNLKSEVERLKKENHMLLEENEKLTRNNKILLDEKESALSRLSKIAGIQLTKGNTGIADLSDANRPTNLAEKWSALYTDAWSDAFDALCVGKTKTTNNFSAEKELCYIVQGCYNKCREIEESQIKDINQHIWDIASRLHERPDQIVSAVKTTQYNKVQKDLEINRKAATMNPKVDTYGDETVLAIYKCSEELIQIVRERRKYDKQMLQHVMQKTVEHFAEFKDQKYEGKIVSYIKRCTELCWSMVIKDPPIVLLYDKMKGQPIDRNEFSHYTKKGSIIDFVVWPALFLYKGGPILAKGVVQGKDHAESDVSKPSVVKDESKQAKDTETKDQTGDPNATFNISQSINPNDHVPDQASPSREGIIEHDLTNVGEKSPIASLVDTKNSTTHKVESCSLKERTKGTPEGLASQQDDKRDAQPLNEEQEILKNTFQDTDGRNGPFQLGDTLNKRVEQ